MANAVPCARATAPSRATSGAEAPPSTTRPAPPTVTSATMTGASRTTRRRRKVRYADHVAGARLQMPAMRYPESAKNMSTPMAPNGA